MAELQPLGSLGGEKGQLVEDLGRAVGVQGAHRAGRAGVHGIEHWHDLLAEHLADDHPVGAHAHRPAHQIGRADPAHILDIGFAPFEGDDLVVALREAVEGKLVVGFDRDQSLARRDVARQCPQKRGLAVAHASADEQVGPGFDGCTEKGPHHGRQRPLPDQVVEADVEEAMQPKKQMRRLAYPGHGEQSRPVGQLQIDSGMGGVEEAFGQADAPAELAHELDELLV